ncbi:hypothetical protein GFK26_22585 [Variovorax paradoxus]|uniref:Uncharacterized protein n=1 Tax=Variovorax paradoxus TaxID=34073 RepID=A0A5Q0MAA7_VARPD|nr:hypothetical protein [Variovorax paradoxus]QFZ85352.1 hypothetical protein GFK26_22585 [Variovorax paradoxus]
MKLLHTLPRSFKNMPREDADMPLKTLTSLLVAAALLSGCAANSVAPALQTRHDATRSIEKVEVIYNAQDQLIVTDGGGSGLTGFAGFFGPIAALLAISADTGSRMTMAARTDQRSKEFTAAVKNSGATMALNRQFAERLAARLRESGREVKLTPFMRATGEHAQMQVQELPPTPGYSTLILRITTSYGAADATSSFKPYVWVEQLLRDEKQSVVGQTLQVADVSEPTYLLYDGLLKDTAGAREGLKRGLDQIVQPAYVEMFGEEVLHKAGAAAVTQTAGIDTK